MSYHCLTQRCLWHFLETLQMIRSLTLAVDKVINLMQAKTSMNRPDKTGSCATTVTTNPNTGLHKWPDNKGKSKTGGGQGGGTNDAGQKDAGLKGFKSLQLVASSVGAPQTKPLNGMTFHWYVTCKHWNMMPSTVTHTGENNKSNNGWVLKWCSCSQQAIHP